MFCKINKFFLLKINNANLKIRDVKGAEGGASVASTGAKRTPEQARRQQGRIEGWMVPECPKDYYLNE